MIMQSCNCGVGHIRLQGTPAVRLSTRDTVTCITPKNLPRLARLETRGMPPDSHSQRLPPDSHTAVYPRNVLRGLTDPATCASGRQCPVCDSCDSTGRHSSHDPRRVGRVATTRRAGCASRHRNHVSRVTPGRRVAGTLACRRYTDCRASASGAQSPVGDSLPTDHTVRT